MPADVNNWLALAFRWLHVIAGVMWIGHLWFFNFVNAQVAKTYDADSKKKVIPELMPRALYWFRWGAAYTWVTGILLLWVVYWAGNAMGNDRMSSYGSGGIGLLIVIICFAIYDVLWKNMKNETTGMIVSLVLFAVVVFIFHLFMGGRAIFIYAGGLLGTIMAANVWMRIWPNQRKTRFNHSATFESIHPPRQKELSALTLAFPDRSVERDPKKQARACRTCAARCASCRA